MVTVKRNVVLCTWDASELRVLRLTHVLLEGSEGSPTCRIDTSLGGW